MSGRGAKLGSFVRGSIPWHCLRLKPGETLLIPDNVKDIARMVHIDLTLRRLEVKVPGAKWKVQTCYGSAAAAPMDGFKFFRITRDL